MSSDLPPVNQARPKSAPSSERNRIRDKNATNACDEAAQTDLPLAKLTTDASTSPVQDSNMSPPPASTNPSQQISSNLHSDDAIRIRSNLAKSILDPIMNVMNDDSNRLQKQLSHDSSQLKTILSSIVTSNNDNALLLQNSIRTSSEVLGQSLLQISESSENESNKLHSALTSNNDLLSMLVFHMTKPNNDVNCTQKIHEHPPDTAGKATYVQYVI